MALILVVDDSSFSRRLTSSMLKDSNYEVIQAEDGESCLEMLESNKPDCIIMDLLMPGENGEEVLKKIRAAGNNIPIIIQTADIQETVQQSCLESGANAVVTKPFNANQLSAKLKEIL